VLTVRWGMRPTGSIMGGITKFSLVHLIHFVVMFFGEIGLDCLYIYPSIYLFSIIVIKFSSIACHITPSTRALSILLSTSFHYSVDRGRAVGATALNCLIVVERGALPLGVYCNCCLAQS